MLGCNNTLISHIHSVEILYVLSAAVPNTIFPVHAPSVSGKSLNLHVFVLHVECITSLPAHSPNCRSKNDDCPTDSAVYLTTNSWARCVYPYLTLATTSA